MEDEVRILFVFSIFTALMLTVVSCGKESEYAACSMSDSMKQKCLSANGQDQDKCENWGVKCNFSCVVGEHPECKNQACVLYNYEDITSHITVSMSTPICTKECKPDDQTGKSADCDDNALCLPYLNKYYCIPNEFIKHPK